MKVNNDNFTYTDYLTFVNYVVDNTLSWGAEYQNFFTALAIAQIFFEYQISYDENGDFDFNKAWSDIRNYNYEGTRYDLYKFVCDNPDDRDIIPIDQYLYTDMVEQISNKLWEATQKNPIRDAIAECITTINNYLVSAEDKLKDIDMPSALATLTQFTDMLTNEDNKKAVISEIAKTVHKESYNNIGKTEPKN